MAERGKTGRWEKKRMSSSNFVRERGMLMEVKERDEKAGRLMVPRREAIAHCWSGRDKPEEEP